MYISKDAAQEIVEEIGDEIQEHINMMDADGIIIASTNPARLGQVHQGARRIITEGLAELYISEEMETETTKMGINLPLTVRGEIVGVVGITGEKERVTRYGNIVRRMTEIMIQDSIQKDARRYDRRVHYRFIEEWIAKPGPTYSRSFVERGLHLGIDVNRPYRVMIICFPDYGQLSDTLDGQKLLEEMESSIRHEAERSRILYLREPPKQVCLMPLCGDEAMAGTADRLARLVWEKYHRRLVVGLDSGKGDKLDVRQSYMEAKRAVNHALLWGEERVRYDSLSIELLLNELSDGVMLEYLKKLFPGVSREKLGDWMLLIEQYFTYEGSISKIAQALYMHKNTLQYKLKKLAELTGKDLRLASCAADYYAALLCYQKLYQIPGEYRHPEA